MRSPSPSNRRPHRRTPPQQHRPQTGTARKPRAPQVRGPTPVGIGLIATALIDKDLSTSGAPSISQRPEQKVQRGDQPSGPVRLVVPGAALLDEQQLIASLPLARQKVGELAGVAEGVAPFFRSCVDVQPSGWRSVPLDVCQDLAVRKPHGRAHRANEPEGLGRSEESVQADQPAQR